MDIFMEKLLLIGIDTRSMLNSALKLDYDVYSTSYFSTSDTPIIKNQKIILKESDGESCGEFENQFNAKEILDISRDYIDEVDYIGQIGALRWAQPVEIWLAEGVSKLVSKYQEQCNNCNN